MVAFLVKCFHKCFGSNRSRDLIYLHRVCQYVNICKNIALPKSYDVMDKFSEDRPPPCFFESLTRDPCPQLKQVQKGVKPKPFLINQSRSQSFDLKVVHYPLFVFAPTYVQTQLYHSENGISVQREQSPWKLERFVELSHRKISGIKLEVIRTTSK